MLGSVNKLILYTSTNHYLTLTPGLIVIILFRGLGSSCSTAVERMPHDKEAVGSNPAGSRFFLSFSVSHSINQWCVLNRVPHRGATLLIFSEKMHA